jgi:hypothetical protein
MKVPGTEVCDTDLITTAMGLVDEDLGATTCGGVGECEETVHNGLEVQ